MGRRARQITGLGAAVIGALAIVGCGSSAHFANIPRPPQPIDLSVYVDNNHVAVSPAHFGGGPVRMIVTNESTGTETLNIMGSGKLVATSHQIDSGQTAEVDANLKTGIYFADAGADVQTAKISVGRERPNADNALLQP